MPEVAKPVFLVNAYSEPILIRIDGRASFQNSGCINDFFGEMFRQGKSRFVIDFEHCTSMDSTFMGVLAGAALHLRRQAPAGTLVCTRLGQRNFELLRNLGLHRLLTVDAGSASPTYGRVSSALDCNKDRSEIENARLCLEAHENLVETDEENRSKFQDVLSFLRNRVAAK